MTHDIAAVTSAGDIVATRRTPRALVTAGELVMIAWESKDQGLTWSEVQSWIDPADGYDDPMAIQVVALSRLDELIRTGKLG